MRTPFSIDTDCLHAARAFQGSDAVQPVPEPFQPGQHVLAEAGLDGQSTVAPMRPVGALALLADVQRGASSAVCGSAPRSIIAVSTCRLTCTWLSAPGVPSTAQQPAILEHHRRVHRVAHALAGRQPVGVPGRQMPIGHAVVQQDAGIARGHAGAEAGVEALDAGDRVARRVDHAEIRRVAVAASGSASARSAARAMSIDGRAFVGVGVRQQPLERHVAEARVGAVALAVRKARFFASTSTWMRSHRIELRQDRSARRSSASAAW